PSPRRAALRAVRPRPLRAVAAVRALRRDAPARGLHPHAARRTPDPAARRAVRRSRRDHPRRDAGVVGRGVGGRAAHGRGRDARRPGGARAGRPRGRSLAATRARRNRARRRPPPPPPTARADRRPGVRRARGPGSGGTRAMRRRRYILTAVLLLGVLGVWQVVASLPGVDHLTLASPAETARALTGDAGLLFSNAGTTLVEVGLGLAISVALGAGAAIGMHL